MFQEHKLRHKHNMIFIVIIFLIISIIYIKFFSNNINIKPFGIEVLKVKSNSMSPKFIKNDIIIIKEEKEYEIGDIITYISKDKELITHRIIEKNENVFYTKGDNNNTKDEQEILKSKIIR